MTEIVKFVNTIIVENAVTSQTLVSGVQGPPGATGPAGVAGVAGPAGPQGTPGAVLVNLANSVALPIQLTSGQALYNYAAGTSTDYGDRLFIGVPGTNGTDSILVGGKYYTNLIDTATSLATANVLVKRDNSGKLTGDITGNSATATKLTTARSVSIIGDVVASAVNFDGSNNIQLNAALATQTGLSTGTYGSSTLIPILTINNKGVITGITTQTVAGNSLPLGADNNTFGSVVSGSILQILGGTGITTSASSNSITIGINSNVATTTGTQTLTNKTISTNSTWEGNTIGLSSGGTGSTTGSIFANTDLTFSSTGTLNLNAQMIDIGGSVLTNLTTPQQDTDAATKAYVDALKQGLDVKDSVKVATTTNITLSGQQSIDGVSVVNGERVLVKNQNTASENGIWIVDSQSWYRSGDADTSDKVTAGLFTFVEQGTQNAGNAFILIASDLITLGASNLTFTQFSGGGTVLVGSGLTKTGNTISANFSGSYTDLTNKPTIPAAQIQSDWNATSGVSLILNKPTLFSGSYTDLTNKPTLFSGSYSDLTNKPTIPAAQVQSDWTAVSGLSLILNKPTLFSGSYTDLTNKPTLFSGSYTDLTNKPTIPAAQVQTDWNAVSGLGVILNKPTLFSGSYTDLTNKPTIPAAQVQTDWNATTGLAAISNKPNFATVATSGSYTDLTNRFAGYDNEIHVSQVDGDNTTGNGDLLNPVATITKAMTLVNAQRRKVIVHSGGYTEDFTIDLSYVTLTSEAQKGDDVVITGTVTANKGCTISGLKMTNLTITAATATGSVNILGCDITGTLTKSGAADYTLIRFCDIGTTNITGSGGLVAIFGGNPNFITINNAGARVIVKNAVTVSPVLTAGNANFVDSILLASTATGNAITSAAGTIVTLANSQFIVPTFNNVARVSLSGFYSIFNCVYDKPNSTLAALSASGGSTNSVDYFQYINADRLILATGGQITFPDGSVQNTAGGSSAQVQTDWNATTGLGAILNKPNFAAVATSGNYSDLTNKPALFSGSYSDLTNKPVIPAAQVQTDWNATTGLAVILNKPTLFSGSYSDLTNKPTLFSGSYTDLTNKPTNLATTTYVDTQVSNLVNSAPATLDTLNELATALGNDANFSTTIATAIANKVNTSALATVATSGSYADLSNKPTLFSGSYSDLSNKPTLFSGSYSDLTNKPTLFSGSYTDLSDKPVIPTAQVQTDWNATTGLAVILNKPTLFSGSYTDLTNKPTLFSGSYTDLTNKPVIPAAQVQTDWNATTGLAVILNKPTLFSGSYSDLTNKPTIPAAYTLPTAATDVLGGVKVDGTTITINNGVISSSGGGGSLTASGVTAATYTNATVTVNTYGQVTAASSGMDVMIAAFIFGG
jgi:hypothetical protein